MNHIIIGILYINEPEKRSAAAYIRNCFRYAVICAGRQFVIWLR